MPVSVRSDTCEPMLPIYRDDLRDETYAPNERPDPTTVSSACVCEISVKLVRDAKGWFEKIDQPSKAKSHKSFEDLCGNYLNAKLPTFRDPRASRKRGQRYDQDSRLGPLERSLQCLDCSRQQQNGKKMTAVTKVVDWISLGDSHVKYPTHVWTLAFGHDQFSQNPKYFCILETDPRDPDVLRIWNKSNEQTPLAFRLLPESEESTDNGEHIGVGRSPTIGHAATSPYSNTATSIDKKLECLDVSSEDELMRLFTKHKVDITTVEATKARLSKQIKEASERPGQQDKGSLFAYKFSPFSRRGNSDQQEFAFATCAACNESRETHNSRCSMRWKINSVVVRKNPEPTSSAANTTADTASSTPSQSSRESHILVYEFQARGERKCVLLSKGRRDGTTGIRMINGRYTPGLAIRIDWLEKPEDTTQTPEKDKNAKSVNPKAKSSNSTESARTGGMQISPQRKRPSSLSPTLAKRSRTTLNYESHAQPQNSASSTPALSNANISAVPPQAFMSGSNQQMNPNPDLQDTAIVVLVDHNRSPIAPEANMIRRQVSQSEILPIQASPAYSRTPTIREPSHSIGREILQTGDNDEHNTPFDQPNTDTAEPLTDATQRPTRVLENHRQTPSRPQIASPQAPSSSQGAGQNPENQLSVEALRQQLSVQQQKGQRLDRMIEQAKQRLEVKQREVLEKKIHDYEVANDLREAAFAELEAEMRTAEAEASAAVNAVVASA